MEYWYIMEYILLELSRLLNKDTFLIHVVLQLNLILLFP